MTGVQLRDLAIWLALIVLAVAPAAAEDGSKIVLIVEAAWARAAPATAQPATAYLTIINEGTAADRLLSLSSPVAESVTLAEHKMENGVMTMSAVTPFKIEPGQSVVLKPGGVHAMLTGLKHPLKVSDSFPLTLTFEKAGTREVTVKVEKPGAMRASDAGHAAHATDGADMPHSRP